eukprot:4047705-Lingulodinium_polyedra.AAC.1
MLCPSPLGGENQTTSIANAGGGLRLRSTAWRSKHAELNTEAAESRLPKTASQGLAFSNGGEAEAQ